MSMTRALGALGGVGLVLFLWANAEAQLAKQGTYSSHFGYYAVGKTFEIEKDHVLFAVFVTPTSGYALHKGEWQLP